MNPLAKIIRPRKNKDKAAKQPQTIEQQPTQEAPRPLDESELKLVGGGGGGDGTKVVTNGGEGNNSPRGGW